MLSSVGKLAATVLHIAEVVAAQSVERGFRRAVQAGT